MSENRTNPYLGPEFFRRSEAHLFFGRTQEVRDLVSLAATERVLLFYASSGAGKTSLLNAKLIPQLEERRYEVLPIGRVSGAAAVEPGANIYSYNLMLSLVGEEVHPERFAKLSLSDFLWHLSTTDGEKYFYDESDGAIRLSASKEDLWPRVLILDQFEEIVTAYPTRWEDRENFFFQIDEALHSDPMLRVIMSMRSDFVQNLDRYQGLLEGGLHARYHMLSLSPANAKEAIEEPAKLPEHNHPFAEGLADRLVANMSQVREVDPDGTITTRRGEWVEPIQLQVVCYQLWERLWPQLSQTPGAQMTIDDLNQLRPTGGATSAATIEQADEQALLAGLVDGALADFYASALAAALTETGEAIGEAVLHYWFSTKLITEGGARSFLERKSDQTAGMPEAVVAVLVDRHLLRSDTRGSMQLVELVHDRFVSPILEANRRWNESRVQSQPWVAAGLQWHDSGDSPANRDAALLLRDETLATAIAQESARQQFEPTIEEFIRASREAQEERDRKQEVSRLQQERKEMQERADQEARARASTKKLALIAGIAALMAIVSTIFAVIQWDRAKKAQEESFSLLLANSAQQKLADDPDAALALAFRANEAVGDRQAANVPSKASMMLAKAIYGSPTQKRMKHGAPIYSVAFSDSHDIALSGGEDGSVVAWNAESGKEHWREDKAHEGKVWSAAISSDGKRGLTAGDDGQVIYWDLEAGTKIPCVAGDFGKVFDVAFDPTGRPRALFGGEDSKLHLWDLEKCQPVGAPLEGHTDWVYSVAFSPDGRQAISGSEDQTAVLWDLESGEQIRRLGEAEIGKTHRDWVRAVAFSPDGRSAVTASRDLRVWDLSTGQIIRLLSRGPQMQGAMRSTIYDVAFDPTDPNRLLSASDELELWEIEQVQVIHTLPGHTRPVRAAAFGEGGLQALSGSLDGDLRLWDLSAGAQVGRFPEKGAGISPMVFQRGPQECEETDETAVHGMIDRASTVILERSPAGDAGDFWSPDMDQYVGRAGTVLGLRGSDSSGCPFVGVALDGQEVPWRVRDLLVATGPGAVAVLEANSARILDIDSESLLGLVQEGSRLILTDGRSGQPLGVFEHAGATHGVLAGDGQVVSAGEDGLRLWRLGVPAEIARWPAAGDEVTGTFSIVGLAASNADGEPIEVTAVNRDGRIFRWRPGSQEPEQPPATLGLTATSAAIAAVDAILFCRDDGSLYWWNGSKASSVRPSGPDTRTGVQDARDRDCNSVLDLARQPGSPERYTGLVSTEQGVRAIPIKHQYPADPIIETKGGKTWEAKPGFDESGEIAGWLGSPGKPVVIQAGETLKSWNVASGGTEDFPFAMPVGWPAVFGADPDVTYLGGQTSGVTRLEWPTNLSEGPDANELVRLDQLPFTGLAMGRVGDEEVIVTSSYSGTLALWDAADGRPVKRFDVAEDPLYGLTTSQDGRWAAAGTAAGDVILWDLKQKQEAGRLSGVPSQSTRHQDAALAVALDAAGDRVLTGGLDGKAFLWNRAASTIAPLAPVAEGKRGPIRSIAMDAKGKLALLGREDGLIEVWRLDQEPRLLGTLAGHEGHAINSVAITADGRTAISSAEMDARLILWDVNERTEIVSLMRPPEAGRIALGPTGNPSGQRALSVGPDQTFYLWQLLPSRDGLAKWVGDDEIRDITPLPCEEWDQLSLDRPKNGCKETPKNTATVLATPEPTAEARQVVINQPIVHEPKAAKQGWRFAVPEPGQWLSITVRANRPVRDAPSDEWAERGRLSLNSILRDQQGSQFGFTGPTRLDAGEYDLTITSDGDLATGSYSLLVSDVSKQPISLGETVAAAIEPATVYSFRGSKDQYVRILMRSSEIDSYLDLYQQDGPPVAQDDDGGGGKDGLDARISVQKLPADGEYTIVPRALDYGRIEVDGSITGAYKLTLSTPPMQPITTGETVSGTITSAPVYLFRGSKDQYVRILMRSEEIDSYLQIYGPDGQPLSSDDNSGGDDAHRDAQITVQSLPADGDYTIVASTPGGSQSGRGGVSPGNYTLTLSTQPD